MINNYLSIIEWIFLLTEQAHGHFRFWMIKVNFQIGQGLINNFPYFRYGRKFSRQSFIGSKLYFSDYKIDIL